MKKLYAHEILNAGVSRNVKSEIINVICKKEFDELGDMCAVRMDIGSLLCFHPSGL